MEAMVVHETLEMVQWEVLFLVVDLTSPQKSLPSREWAEVVAETAAALHPQRFQMPSTLS